MKNRQRQQKIKTNADIITMLNHTCRVPFYRLFAEELIELREVRQHCGSVNDLTTDHLITRHDWSYTKLLLSNVKCLRYIIHSKSYDTQMIHRQWRCCYNYNDDDYYDYDYDYYYYYYRYHHHNHHQKGKGWSCPLVSLGDVLICLT